MFDVLRRGMDNAIANWQLVAIRFGETLLFGILTLVTALSLIVPVLVSAGIAFGDLDNPADLLAAAAMLLERWIILFWIVIAITFLLVLFLAVHSFVEAGRARVLVIAERAAGPEPAGPRIRFAVFSLRQWYAGAAGGWWPVFWIYNVVWGIAGLLILIPLLPTFLMMLVLRERPAAMVGAGCFGLALTALFGIVVGLVAGMWTTRATAEWALGQRKTRESIAGGWRAIRDDFGRHFLVALAVIVVGMAGSTFFASLSFFASFGQSFGDSLAFNIVTLPIRVIGSLLSWIFSAAVSTWYLASYSSLAVETEGTE